jgi:hypothetical protein
MLEDRNVNTFIEERLRERLPTLPSWSLGVRLQALALRPWTALAVHLTDTSVIAPSEQLVLSYQ